MRMLVALLDVKTDTFLAPMAVISPGEAERTYREILASDTIVGKYPKDFPLYHIGSYDERLGLVAPLVNEVGIAVPPRLLVDSGQLELSLVKEVR